MEKGQFYSNAFIFRTRYSIVSFATPLDTYNRVCPLLFPVFLSPSYRSGLVSPPARGPAGRLCRREGTELFPVRTGRTRGGRSGALISIDGVFRFSCSISRPPSTLTDVAGALRHSLASVQRQCRSTSSRVAQRLGGAPCGTALLDVRSSRTKRAERLEGIPFPPFSHARNCLLEEWPKVRAVVFTVSLPTLQTFTPTQQHTCHRPRRTPRSVARRHQHDHPRSSDETEIYSNTVLSATV